MASQALSDIAATLKRNDIWRTLGWFDIRLRYRRTTLGPFWLTISNGAMIFAIGVLYAGLFHRDVSNYLPNLAIGIIVWNFFNASLTEGCTVFISSAGFIKAYTIPLSQHIMRLLWRNIIIFAHNFVILVLVWAVFRWPLSPVVLLAIPGYAILVGFSLGLILFFGILCTRFRDIPQIIVSVLQLLFFITPIIWSPDSLGSHRAIAELNPLFSLVEIVRAPLMNQLPDLRQWLIGGGSAIISLVVGYAFYGRYGYRIAYWL